MFTSAAYRHSPKFLQEIMISTRAWLRANLREGKQFNPILEEVLATQWLSSFELAEYRTWKLRAIMSYAGKNIPYYQKLFAEYNFNIEQLCGETDLQRLPLMEKSDVRKAGSLLLSKSATKPVFSGATSGTTGTPLRIYQDLEAINRENAYIWRQLLWAGYTPNSRRAWIRGDLIVPIEQKDPPFWRQNRAERMLMLSSYHLSESSASAYIKALKYFDPVVIQAYPSSVGFLASWLDHKGEEYGAESLKGIVTSSESLDATTRALIEKRFGCRVFDWYGQYERVAAIGTCEHGSYHLISDYSTVELIIDERDSHEIIGTSLNNSVMPLVRYRSGDHANPSPLKKYCPCGRSFPLIDCISGRDGDMLNLPGGRKLGRLGHIFKYADDILESQIIQNDHNEVTLLVVPTSKFSTETQRKLLSRAKQYLSADINVTVELTDKIPRGPNGKFRTVINNIKEGNDV